MVVCRSRLLVVSFLLTLALTAPIAAQTSVRLKNIARVKDVREYQLLGDGLGTGLSGTGDKSALSQDMARGMLRNMGMEVDTNSVKTNNIAAVMVTAMIPPFSNAGDRIDITMSSIGDAKSLQGGVLLPTQLKGGNGEVYAVAQGQVTVGGMPAGQGAGGGQNQGGRQQNHLTVGRVPGGAILEREVGGRFAADGTFCLCLERKDCNLARRVKEAVDRKFGEGWAKTIDPGTVRVTVPTSFTDDPVAFAATIQDLPLTIEESNQVVINEKTGTIVIGNNVRISTVSIAQGGLKIDVGGAGNGRAAGQGAGTGSPAAGQAAGAAASSGGMVTLPGDTTVEELVKLLNVIGANPRDMIAILQAIAAAGALHGEIKLI